MTRATNPARDFTVLEGGGRFGVGCCVCTRFISRQREFVLELNSGCVEHSVIICGPYVRRIVVMAGTHAGTGTLCNRRKLALITRPVVSAVGVSSAEVRQLCAEVRQP